MGDAENLVCKTKRIVTATSVSNSDRKFKDIHYKGQEYYEVDVEGIGHYLYHRGERHFVVGNIVGEWNWNGKKVGTYDITMFLKRELESEPEYFKIPKQFENGGRICSIE